MSPEPTDQVLLPSPIPCSFGVIPSVGKPLSPRRPWVLTCLPTCAQSSERAGAASHSSLGTEQASWEEFWFHWGGPGYWVWAPWCLWPPPPPYSLITEAPRAWKPRQPLRCPPELRGDIPAACPSNRSPGRQSRCACEARDTFRGLCFLTTLRQPVSFCMAEKKENSTEHFRVSVPVPTGAWRRNGSCLWPKEWLRAHKAYLFNIFTFSPRPKA